MTITTQDTKQSYEANGVTTDFPFSFHVSYDSEVKALIVVDGVETEYTDFTVTLNTSTAGGTLTTNTVLDDLELLIYRETELTQETDYENGGRFPAESHEQALDKLTQIAQEQQEEIDRCIKFKISDDSGKKAEIGNLEDGKVIGFKDNEIQTIDANIDDAERVSEYVPFLEDYSESDNETTVTPDGKEVLTIQGQINKSAEQTQEVINNFEIDASQVINDFGTNANNAIDEFNKDGEAAIDTFNQNQLAAIAAAGYRVVGNFEDGATLEQLGDAIYYKGLEDDDDKYRGFYAWTGTFDKVVPAGSDPISEDGWQLAATGYLKQSGVIQLFGQTVDVDTVIPVNQNALSINPTIADGVSVTVPAGSTYVILGD